MEFNLIGPSYVDSTKPLSIQDTINWIPEVSEQGQKLLTPAGLQSFAELTKNKCRGMMAWEGLLWAVYGENLFSISSGGMVTDRGYVGGSSPVSMCANALQLVIVSAGVGYYYDGTLHSISGLTGPNTCAFLDQYIIFDGMGGQFQISGLNSAGSIDPLDFATAESAPDDTVAVLVDHQELLIGGTETIEVWVNTGDADFPFQRTQGSLIERGIGAPHSWRKMDNSNVWVDNLGMVQSMAGHSPQRISTHAIEQEIANYLENLDEIVAWTYVDKGHWFYVLQMPDNGKTFVWDANTKQWHRRKSYGFDCWRARYHAQIYGKHLMGDAFTNTLWDMVEGVYTEGEDPMVSERFTHYLHQEDLPVSQHSLWLKFDTGQGTVSGQGQFPLVDIRWSDDGGYTFANFRQRSLGETGQYNKNIRVHGMGKFKDRVFHLRVSDPVKRDLLTGFVRPSVGSNA